MRQSHLFGMPAFERRLENVENIFCVLMNLGLSHFGGGCAVRWKLFIVPKNHGTHRLIVDARQTGRLCRAPLQADLGTVTVLAGLDLSTHVLAAAGCDGLEGVLCGASADLNTWFLPGSRTGWDRFSG